MRPLKRNWSKNTPSISLPSNILHCTEIYILNPIMGFVCTLFLENQNNFNKNKQNFTMANCISIPHVITKRVVVIRVFPWRDYLFHPILFNNHSLNSWTFTGFNFPELILSMCRIEVVINFSKGFVKAFTVEKLGRRNDNTKHDCFCCLCKAFSSEVLDFTNWCV